MNNRVIVEIDLQALVRNYRKIVAHVKPMKVLCVLKANAYGLGVAEYAKALYAAGCENFGVAEPHEALELIRVFSSRDIPVASPLSVDPSQRGRETGSASSLLVRAQRGRDIPVACEKKSPTAFPSIQILSSILPDEIPEMVRAGVILPITDLASARLISAAAVRAKKIARVHFKLDTGMGRLGILASDPKDVDRALETIRAVRALPNLDCEGIFTHCPMAYEPKDPFTKRQVALFKSILAACAKEGITFKKVHMAASDAINNFPETAKKPFTLVRTGINLHGSFDPYGRKALKVEPVLTLKTRVAQVRDLPAGTTLGYGRTWCLNTPTKIATISAGYADGLPLALTNRGFVFIGGRRCKIVGRISMDYTTVDVTDVPNVKAGDEVICFGKCGKDAITPDDWAALKGTHAYDIICSLGNRVRRVIRPLVAVLSLGASALFAHAANPTPVDDARATKLANETLAKMTLEEKVSLCGACATMYLNAVLRVGIDREWAFSDGSHAIKPEHGRPTWGYVTGIDDRSTVLPSMSALAATWNPALAAAHGHVMGEQMRARDKSQMLGPAVNIMRNPVSGRNWEYLSEDPVLAATMAAKIVSAVQTHGVAATMKHYCLNSQELARFTQQSTVDRRTLEEIYLPAFAACAREGGALSVMTAYVRLNGEYCTENAFLQREILRDRWGFKGAIVTDWGAAHSCEKAALSGGGIECNFGRGVVHHTDFWGVNGTNRFPLATAVREGRVPEKVVDEMAFHALYMMARTGFLTGEQEKGERLTEKHTKIAQKIGEESIVLVRNAKNVLPLDRAKLRKLVVFGQVADQKVAHLGSSCEGHPPYEISFLDGLKETLGADCVIENYPLGSEGCTEPLPVNLLDLTTSDPNGKDAFVERAWERRQYRNGKEMRLDYVRSTKVYWNVAAKPGSNARREIGDEFVWTSSVEIRETGDYDFIVDQGDTSKASIAVNGKAIIPLREGGAKATVRLEKGTTCPVEFRFRLGISENRASFGWIPPSSRPAPVETLEKTCREADAVLVFTGTTLGFGRAKEAEGADRPDMLSLDGHDRDIAKILSWKLPRTIIVNRSGSPLEQPWFDECDTYLYASYLGQEAGRPFARVLFGEVNPSGKLPFSWPRKWSDTAIATLGSQTYNPTNCVYLEGVEVGYRWYEKHAIPVQIPFGHGLSYTRFKYGEVAVGGEGEGWRVVVPVTNVGERDGAETVQLYVQDLQPKVTRPVKELKGFAKVFVKKGETAEAVIRIRPRDFAYFDVETMRFVTPKGGYRLLVGSSSADIRATTQVAVATGFSFAP